MNPLKQTLWLLSPELALLLGSGILLVLDRLPLRRSPRRWMHYVALAAPVGGLAATITLWDSDAHLLSILSRDNFALTINTVALVATGILILVSSAYVETRRSRHHGAFYALLLLAALAICLLGAATDLLLIVLGFEAFGIVSYVLVGYPRRGPLASEAAIKYFLYSAVVSAMMLYSLSWVYGLTGSTDLESIATVLGESEALLRRALLPALILMMVGFSFKLAAAPFHQWAPDVYEGTPTPVAAFLAVMPVVAGIAGLARITSVALPPELDSIDLDWHTLLYTLAGLTMLVGSLLALWQQNVKRFLAYSSIAQAGYLLIGLAAASQQGVTATLYGLIAQVSSTLGAFAAIVALSTGNSSYGIEGYAGTHRRAPGVAWPLLLCLLSLAGVPPTAGFVGRLALFLAAIEAGLLWLAIVGALSSVILLAGVWRIIRAMFAAPAQTEERPRISPAVAVALGLAAVGVLAAAILASPLLTLLQAARHALVR